MKKSRKKLDDRMKAYIELQAKRLAYEVRNGISQKLGGTENEIQEFIAEVWPIRTPKFGAADRDIRGHVRKVGSIIGVNIGQPAPAQGWMTRGAK